MKTLLIAMLISTTLFAQERPKSNPLFTRTFSLEMSIAGASIAADGWTTRTISARGFGERNPIARPFVRSNAGSSAYFAGSFGALIGANYLLRNHAKMRHVLNFTVTGVETSWAVYNSRRTTPHTVISPSNCPPGFVCAKAY